MNKKLIIGVPFLVASLAAQSHTVLLSENFDGEWEESFPAYLELDHKNPHTAIRAIFQDEDGVSRPWWVAKDTPSSTDRFLVGHSYYQEPGQSNDWLISKPLQIPSTDFNLTFDAQSLPVRGGSVRRLSDLWVFVSETEITESSLPSEPALKLTEVPVGNSESDIEGDWQNTYTLNLDAWAGKTIYIAFANLNNDKDIIAIDNVKVQRLDNVEVVASSPEYTLAGDYTVTASVKGTGKSVTGPWTVIFRNGEIVETKTGTGLAEGENIDFTFTGNAGVDSPSEWTVEFSTEGEFPVVASGVTNGLGFIPVHRVLMEEGTATGCGNCVMAIHLMEQLKKDPEISDNVIPVAIHMESYGNDYMVNTTYAGLFGVNAAPMIRLDRDLRPFGLSPMDGIYDKTNNSTAAGRVREQVERIVPLSIELDGEFIYSGKDTTGIKVTTYVKPAMTLKNRNLGIGYILVENNVWLKNSRYWLQTNYLSGEEESTGTKWGGWTDLPKNVSNVRFQHVGREVYGYRGLDESLPADLIYGEEYGHTYELEIPDTYLELELEAGKPKEVVSPAIMRSMTSVVAYVYDRENFCVLNAVEMPMTALAESHFDTAALLAEKTGVEVLYSDDSSEDGFYTLEGIRVDGDSLTKGIYIRRAGGKSEKIMVK